MSAEVIICLIFFILYIVYQIFYWISLNMFEWEENYNLKKKNKYEQKYQPEIFGEVVGVAQKYKYNDFAYMTSRRLRRYKRTIYYSPIIRYTVSGCTYEIDAKEYTLEIPEIGERALVWYNPVNPADACGRLDRSIFRELGEGEEWMRLDSEK